MFQNLMNGAFSFWNGEGPVVIPSHDDVQSVAGAAAADGEVANVTPVVAASATNDNVTVRFNFSLAMAASD